MYKPSIRMAGMGGTVVSPQQRMSKIISAGYNVFELRHKKSDPNSCKIIGFDQVQVDIMRSPNSHEVRYRPRIVKASDATFEPDEENIRWAYIPDTEKNRRLLAKMIWTAPYVITQLITPTGNIPEAQINQEIHKAAELLGVQKPVPQATRSRHLKGPQHNRAQEIYSNLNPAEKEQLISLLSGQVSKETPKMQTTGHMDQPPAQVPPPGPRGRVKHPDMVMDTRMQVPPPGPREPQQVTDQTNFTPPPGTPPTPPSRTVSMTMEEAEAVVHQQNQMLVDFLKKQSPKGWKNTKEYRGVIVPIVEKVFNENQVEPAAPAQPPAPAQGGIPDLNSQIPQGAGAPAPV